ncbi:MAG: metallophosphoesterase family protein [Candidatus Omnitrophica bacterium]|nr:metallophosphoesterase family protein [Candidatus Omnitrophota bacterium]
MKICLFSDIHGNGPAFEAAYTKLMGERADLNIFLGDLCGYYFDELEIYQKLVSMPGLVALRGNHDEMFLSAAEGDSDVQSQYLMKYGTSIENFLSKDNKPLVDWLKKRPRSYSCEEIDMTCYHGSPVDQIDGYIYPDTALKEISNQKENNFFLGHTHYPMSRFVGEKMIVNPGSLGQPRQGGWPTYVVVTLPERKVEFKEVPYDVDQLREVVEKKGEKNSYLKDVLLRCYGKCGK